MIRPDAIPPVDTIAEATTLALSVLAWTLGDDARATRLLDLTGLTPDLLRQALVAPGASAPVLAAVCAFVEAHDPDLVAAADALGVAPSAIVAARRVLADNRIAGDWGA